MGCEISVFAEETPPAKKTPKLQHNGTAWKVLRSTYRTASRAEPSTAAQHYQHQRNSTPHFFVFSYASTAAAKKLLSVNSPISNQFVCTAVLGGGPHHFLETLCHDLVRGIPTPSTRSSSVCMLVGVK